MAQPEGGAGGGPTVLRMLLGATLRRLREAKNISREAAGYEIRSSRSQNARLTGSSGGVFRAMTLNVIPSRVTCSDPASRVWTACCRMDPRT